MSDRQSRSRSHGSRSQDGMDRELRDFRDRFPVDDSAFDFLAKAPEKVVKIVLESFQPRGQNSYHKDYSALLTKFVRSIIERQGGKGKGKGKKESKGRWADVRDVRDRSRGRSRDGGDDRGRDRRNRKDSRDRRESREPRRSTRERGRRRSRQRSDDSRGKRSQSTDRKAKKKSKDRKADARSYSASASRGRYSDGAKQAESDESNFSGADEESGSEGDLRKRAEEIRTRRTAVAVENEKDKLAEAEEEERRISYEKVMKLEDDAEKEMRDKLAEYEDLLQTEKKVRLEHGKRDVEAASRRRLNALADELEEDRKRELKDAQAEFDNTIKNLKDLQEEKKKGRLQKKRQKELVNAMGKKGESPNKPKKEESKRSGSVDSAEDKPRRRRDGFGRDRDARDGERAHGHDSYEEDSRDDSRRRDGDRRDRGDRRNRSRSCSRASPSRSRSQDPRAGGSSDLDRELRDFRHRWPVDDSAYDFLAKAPEKILKIVLSSFKPRGQSSYHKDYSALLTKFVQSIMERQGGGRRSDRDDRGTSERETRGSASGPPSRALLDFRDRYPMDDRAFDIVAAAPQEIIQDFLDGFKAKREGESDYSGLVVSFLRSVQARAKERGGRQDGRRRSRDRGHERSRSQRGRDGKRNDSPVKNGESAKGGESPFTLFRSRYPLSDKAWAILDDLPDDVHDIVIKEFKAKQENQKDYTEEVLAFVERWRGKDGEEGSKQ